MTDYEQILHERRGEIVLLTLNRPNKLNAWTPKMSAELAHAIAEANDDDAVGAIVVTGAGRGFCAGADVDEQFASALHDGRSPVPTADEADIGQWVRMCRESKPLVAAINGAAIGVGLSMVLPFDVLVAAEGAKLSARFVKMGVVPELASSHFLVARCGFGAASYLALTGAIILADEARELRLVDRVVPAERVVDDAIAIATEIAGNPPPQVRMAKQLLTTNASETDLDAVQRREMAALAVAYETPEHAEAVNAFLEKRPPKFR